MSKIRSALTGIGNVIYNIGPNAPSYLYEFHEAMQEAVNDIDALTEQLTAVTGQRDARDQLIARYEREQQRLYERVQKLEAACEGVPDMLDTVSRRFVDTIVKRDQIPIAEKAAAVREALEFSKAAGLPQAYEEGDK